MVSVDHSVVQFDYYKLFCVYQSCTISVNYLKMFTLEA